MANIAFAAHAAHDIATPFSSLGRSVFSFLRMIADWNRTRVTRNALHRLGERQLADIGISLGDIERIQPTRL